MNARHVLTSQARTSQALSAASVPGRLLLTLKLGEVPEHLPGLRAVADLARGAGVPVTIAA